MNRCALTLWLTCVSAFGANPIDLPTALRLAGAQNLDVQIAHEKVAEAQATREGAVAQFFPWISPGIGYRKHEGRTQDVAGSILDASKQSYTAGGTLNAQVELGNAFYKSLEAKQLVKAADYALESQRDLALTAAALGYFDLARAQAAAGVAREAVRISSDYEDQLQHAVASGIAFKGDALRVRGQTQRNQLLLRQAQEQQRLAAARLAQTLHLDATVELVAQDAELVPLTLVDTNAALDSLVQQALTRHPDLEQTRALLAAAIDARKGAVYGPLIPTVGAQAFVGGLGGGTGASTGDFGESEDYLVTLSWRIGPGGLFDSSRIHAADARRRGSQLLRDKVQDEIVRQVVDATTRIRSLADQINTTRQALATAEETLLLTAQRKEFGVGIVLEYIQAEQDLTRSRNDYLNVVAEFDKAQYTLVRALGQSGSRSVP
jgi:outer membrane protein TolC